MYKVTLIFALLVTASLARSGRGGSGSGAGAGTGNAGPGGDSALDDEMDSGISSAQNGGFGTGTGTGTAQLNFFTGQAGATGQGNGSRVGKK